MDPAFNQQIEAVKTVGFPIVIALMSFGVVAWLLRQTVSSLKTAIDGASSRQTEVFDNLNKTLQAQTNQLAQQNSSMQMVMMFMAQNMAQSNTIKEKVEQVAEKQEEAKKLLIEKGNGNGK